jgi:hypothetical protein
LTSSAFIGLPWPTKAAGMQTSGISTEPEVTIIAFSRFPTGLWRPLAGVRGVLVEAAGHRTAPCCTTSARCSTSRMWRGSTSIMQWNNRDQWVTSKQLARCPHHQNRALLESAAVQRSASAVVPRSGEIRCLEFAAVRWGVDAGCIRHWIEVCHDDRAHVPGRGPCSRRGSGSNGRP